MSRYDLSDRELQDALYCVHVENIGDISVTDDYEQAMKNYKEYIEYAKVTPTTNQVSLWSSTNPDPLQEFQCLSDEPISDLEDIEIGTGATMICRDDKLPFTVVEIIDDTHITVQEDDSHCYNVEKQYYKYTKKLAGYKCSLSKRKNGQWYIVGQTMHSGWPFTVGLRERWHRI